MAFLADAESANDFLDGTKLAFADDTEAEPEARQADAIVRSSLADISTDAGEWGSEETPTPEIVKVIASMLMASLLYAKRYSEEALGENDYASRLWNRAMELITGLRAGTIELGGDIESAIAFNRDDFWPNDLTVDSAGNKIRMFDTRMRF